MTICENYNSSQNAHLWHGRRSFQEVRAQQVELGQLATGKHVQARQRARHDCAQLAQQRVLQQLLGAIGHLSAAVA